MASLTLRDLALFSGSLLIQQTGITSDPDNSPVTNALNLIRYRKDEVDVGFLNECETLSSDTEISPELARHLTEPPRFGKNDKIGLAKLNLDGDFLRVLTNRPVVKFKQNATFDLRASSYRDTFVIAARTIIFAMHG
jgi:hypothetical protein